MQEAQTWIDETLQADRASLTHTDYYVACLIIVFEMLIFNEQADQKT